MYLGWRWPTWRAQTAHENGGNLVGLVRRVWSWLEVHRQVRSWETFRRADLEAWLKTRYLDAAIRTSMAHPVLGSSTGY